ncbi:uncharacterized protein I303_102750 [Kwoniella dejecticola CBS 10117]|uniref:Uncharacterized protein n=1 Tax=Kwoniella dejecticola CBS 10117 TaxID=1296121 RepID=A0A1A6A9L2_9TREE|nr:uncharacterized protein I303_02765 [Kwoniella dejecticola CBS 10117]OBR86751.1 hypothetical protein I303_02765 [Kwoniella dejecticola CBS 10117]
MSLLPSIPRACKASSSRLPHSISAPVPHIRPPNISSTRSLSLLPSKSPASIPFLLPHFGLGGKHQVHLPLYGANGNGKGKGKGKEPQNNQEEEVDDREWDIRVARAMIHLRETLPLIFDPEMNSTEMFPHDVFSKHVVLKLPAPLPLKISSLSGYSMAYSLARSGMQALHTDLRTDLERMSFSPSPANLAQSDPRSALILSRKPTPTHRQRQIRVQVAVYGIPRLPPHKEAKWYTSSLYTFSPYSGLITSHEVETIRPLPGEGVAEWLMSRLLGWTSRQSINEGAVPCPRTVALPTSSEMERFRRRPGSGDKDRP